MDEITEHLFVLNSHAAATTDTTAGELSAAWLWGWVPVWLRRGLPWLSPPALPGPHSSVTMLDLAHQ